LLANNALAFGINSSEVGRFTSTGLGIGTSSPVSPLTINGNDPLITLKNAGTNRWQFGLENTSSNRFVFYDNTAAAYRLIIDSSGNVGIGTSSPAVKLDVVDNSSNAQGQIRLSSSSGFGTRQTFVNTATNGRTFQIGCNFAVGQGEFSILDSTAGVERLQINASGNLGLGVTPSAWASGTVGLQVRGISLYSFTGANNFLSSNAYYNGTAWTYQATAAVAQYQMQGAQHAWYQAASGTAGNAITWTQAMTLDTSGNLLVGATAINTAPSFGVCFAGNNGGVSYQSIGHANGTASGNAYVFFAYNSTAIGSITQSGTTAVLYNLTSDQRLKENIQDAESSSSLIDAIQVRQFDWKSDGSHTRYGFVAQELVTVAPEAVHQPADPDEMMAVDYSKLVPMLVKEIQSLRQRLSAANL
jgi:hypothetical protein